jgi:hypothetical protein
MSQMGYPYLNSTVDRYASKGDATVHVGAKGSDSQELG